jgi:Tol biopolymer transport system component
VRGRTRILVGVMLAGALSAGLSPMGADAAYKGENGRVFFYRYVEDSGYELFSMKADGSDRTRLTEDFITDADPIVSPDGRRIAWERTVAGADDVFTMKVDGSGTKNLTAESEGIRDEDPAWSPNGNKIVFASDREAQQQLWVMKSDGSEPVQLTTDEATEETNPAWSPNGRWIAFTREAEEGPPLICRIRPDGSDESCLTGQGFAAVDDPDWSPDSKKLVFEGRQPDDETPRENIFVMKADGTGKKQLTERSDDASDPAYSPSGAWIVFETNVDTPNEMYRMKADGTDESRVTPKDYDVQDPHWAVKRS